LDWLSGKIGSSQAVIVIAFVLTLIVAVKAFLVAMAGHLLRCRIRFETALRASAYAFGTFIFVQYVLIAIRFLAANIFGDPGFQFGYAVVIYGSLMISMLLVVRMNQLIRQVDGVTELASYSAWLLGTFVWHFGIVLGAIYMLRLGGLANYWSIYFQWLGLFGSALYPPSWYGGL